MSLPREVIPGRYYLVTRRCTQRQFLLRPDDATNNAFIYCLGEAAQRFEIDIMATCAMSNHHHTVIFDRHGRYPQFLEHFHKIFARSQNALRGRWENFWSNQQVSVVHLVDRGDILRKLVYTITNPVKDHLVDKVHHWPGVNSWNALRNRRPLVAHRPAHFFRTNGPMPEMIELKLSIPPGLGASFVDELATLVGEAEAKVAQERSKTGRCVIGRRGILRQPWRGQPESKEPRRGLRPRVAARDQWSRIEALGRNKVFLIAYREARVRWRAGETVAFPVGTYWLSRFAHVPVAVS
jgi:REP-associated tyrosine transposase